jgi:hypothetical protein
VEQFKRHITDDVLPPLLDRLLNIMRGRMKEVKAKAILQS